MKGRIDLSTMIGWQARRFHHLQQPKPLAHYLEPAPSPERKADKGANDVLAMMRRLHKKQKGRKDGV